MCGNTWHRQIISWITGLFGFGGEPSKEEVPVEDTALEPPVFEEESANDVELAHQLEDMRLHQMAELRQDIDVLKEAYEPPNGQWDELREAADELNKMETITVGNKCCIVSTSS